MFFKKETELDAKLEITLSCFVVVIEVVFINVVVIDFVGVVIDGVGV